jgi:formylglycine-generating enzyme required for sulfatase activity
MTVAWFNRPVRSDPHSRGVGQKIPNAWGLYDMLGNLWEWTADEYRADGYRLHQASNPLVEQDGARRVIRGASYSSDRFLVRCGSRNYGIPDDPLPTQGLRLVRQSTAN